MNEVMVLSCLERQVFAHFTAREVRGTVWFGTFSWRGLEKEKTMNKRSRQGLILLGDYCFSRGLLYQAELAFQQARFTAGLMMIGDCYVNKGLLEPAVRVFQRSKRTLGPVQLSKIGRVALQRGDLVIARKAFQRAGDRLGTLQVAQKLGTEGPCFQDVENAIKILDALEVPVGNDLLREWGMHHLHERRFDVAIRVFALLKDEAALLAVATTAIDEGLREEAQTALREVGRTLSKEQLIRIAEISIQQGRWDDVVLAYAEAQRILSYRESEEIGWQFLAKGWNEEALRVFWSIDCKAGVKMVGRNLLKKDALLKASSVFWRSKDIDGLIAVAKRLVECQQWNSARKTFEMIARLQE